MSYQYKLYSWKFFVERYYGTLVTLLISLSYCEYSCELLWINIIFPYPFYYLKFEAINA
jgi:hypothetical protein